MTDDDQEDKVRENRLRRMAERQGLALQKCRRRDPRALGFGTYRLVDPLRNRVVASIQSMGDYGYDLADVEQFLTEREGPREPTTTRDELDVVTVFGGKAAKGAFVAAYMAVQSAAYGYGRHSGEIEPTRRAIYAAAVEAVRQAIPSFSATVPEGWLERHASS